MQASKLSAHDACDNAFVTEEEKPSDPAPFIRLKDSGRLEWTDTEFYGSRPTIEGERVEDIRMERTRHVDPSAVAPRPASVERTWFARHPWWSSLVVGAITGALAIVVVHFAFGF
jgi:hypothetical protein